LKGSLFIFSGIGSAGLWLDDVVTWAERSTIEIEVIDNTIGILFDSHDQYGSFDYSSYSFKISANANQNGVVLQNNVSLFGTDIIIRGNFLSGSTNTGVALTIGANSSDSSSISASHVLCQVETDGTTGVAHTTISLGNTAGGAVLSGNGVLSFIAGNGLNWQTGNASNHVAFTGYINVDAGLGTMGYWQGSRTIGVATTTAGYMSPTGTIYTSNILMQQLQAGSQTITVDPTTQTALNGQALAIDLLIQQPASGTATATWPGSFVWLTGSPPMLSTAANAIDHIRLVTLDNVTYYGEHLNPAASSSEYAPGQLLTYTAYTPLSSYMITGGAAAAAVDSTNFKVTFTTAASGPGSTSVKANITLGSAWCPDGWAAGVGGTGAPALMNLPFNGGGPIVLPIYTTGLTPHTAYTWYLYAQAYTSGDNATIYSSYTTTIEICAGLD
jgi:hypothetical protein